MKKTMLILLVVAVAMQAGFVHAAEKKQFGTDLAVILKPLNGQEEKTFATKLQLTQEQQNKLRQVNNQYRSDVQNLSRNYQSMRQELVNALQANDPQSRVITQKLKAVHRAQSSLVEREVDYWSALAGVLTPAQATEFWRMFGRTRLRGDNAMPVEMPETSGGKGSHQQIGN